MLLADGIDPEFLRPGPAPDDPPRAARARRQAGRGLPGRPHRVPGHRRSARRVARGHGRRPRRAPPPHGTPERRAVPRPGRRAGAAGLGDADGPDRLRGDSPLPRPRRRRGEPEARQHGGQRQAAQLHGDGTPLGRLRRPGLPGAPRGGGRLRADAGRPGARAPPSPGSSATRTSRSSEARRSGSAPSPTSGGRRWAGGSSMSTGPASRSERAARASRGPDAPGSRRRQRPRGERPGVDRGAPDRSVGSRARRSS